MQQDEAVSDLPCCVLDEITTVRERIRTGAAAGDWKEAQTRASLIDPVLSALGWEVTDPRLVQQEYRARGKSADYALLRADGKPEVIIEAKALGRRLRVKEIDQTVAYAVILEAPLAALTDGDHWMLYEVFRRVPIEERKQFDIRVSDGSAEAVAQELLALRRSDSLSAYRSEPAPPPSPQGFPAPPPAPPNGSVLTLSEVPLKTRQTKPTALLFPDGSGQPITHWYEVLLRTAEWLARTGALGNSDLPVKWPGGNKYLVAASAVHATGRAFSKPKRVAETGFVLEAWGNSARLLRHTRWLVEHCGNAPSTIRLRFQP